MSETFVRRVGVAAFVIWLIWALHPLLAKRMQIPWDSETVGQWGDAFGALNALFSALAFVAVLVTLKQQRDDVARQLQQQRADIARQQQQIDTAAADQHLQRFERTFYELLRLLREARSDVEFRYSTEYLTDSIPPERAAGERVNGPEAFKRANFELRHWWGRQNQMGEVPNAKAAARLYTQHVHTRYESSFAPYYRLLYTILLRIHEDAVLGPHQKARYGNLLRSQLTSHEVALSCFNGLAAYSGSFKGLIVEFRIPKYLPDEFGRKILELYYPKSAFLGRD